LPARIEALLSDFASRRSAALARAVSIVENQREGTDEILGALHPKLGRSRRIGITGPPGAGKSTITALMTKEFRAAGLTVGIVCVDPTSPFTGGALLGDRVRMESVSLDDGVFIRSMATRGSLGGLAASTREVSDVLDGYGFDRIIIETVGVGQSELDVARTADSTVVVLVPESGDSIQTLKAGVMEIADVFVINKSDRPGADRLRNDVELMLGLRKGTSYTNMPAHHGVDLKRIMNPARVAREDAQDRAMRDDAVEAVVGAGRRDDDHLALGLGEPAFLLHQRVVVGEEGAELVGAVGQRQEDVRHEAGLLLHGEDAGADVVGQVVEPGHRIAADRHRLHAPESSSGPGRAPWGGSPAARARGRNV